MDEIENAHHVSPEPEEGTPFKSGFVAVMGRPNVGKSTLINHLMRQKIAAVSPRPQTTRKKQLGILTLEDAQIVFFDTPGVHKPVHKLGESMNQAAIETLQDSDLVLFVGDISEPPNEEDQLLAQNLVEHRGETPTLLVLNKLDRVSGDEREERENAFRDIVPHVASVSVSAERGDNLEELLSEILERLPEGMPFFPAEQITDLYERDLAADLIREASLYLLRDEVPHGIAVRIDQFLERGSEGAYIEATLFVEKESHKGIVIGQGGQMLKKIGSRARREIEQMSGRKVFIRLRVKVRKNWRDDERVLRWFGY